jgi:hypothetical protein
MSQLGRARYTDCWPAATSMGLVRLAGMSSHVASDTTRVRMFPHFWSRSPSCDEGHPRGR